MPEIQKNQDLFQKCRDYKNALRDELIDRVNNPIGIRINSREDELIIYFEVYKNCFIYTDEPIRKLIEDDILPDVIAEKSVDCLIGQIVEYILK